MAKTGGGGDGDGLEVLQHLKSTDPPLFLTPSADLSLSSRTASQYIFSSLKPYAPKSPFDELLTDGFDAEQIWQQIDLQSQPLVSSLRREIKRFEKEPARISNGFGAAAVADVEREDESESDGFEDDDEEEEDDEKEEEDDEEEDEEMEVESEDYASGEEVEDKFLKIKELEKYLKEDEEREYGLKPKAKKASAKSAKKTLKEEDGDGEMEDEEEEDDDDDQLGLFEGGDEDDELENARYEDFYVSNKKPKKESKRIDRSEDWDEEDEQEDNKREKPQKESEQSDRSDDSDAEDEQEENKREKKLSRHEKEQKQIQAKIKEMEKSSMDPKTWTMQGEVTAAKRPLNSALEADLDFEHNVRPPPVITEEVTASIEEIIKKRIVEGRFDDVQRAAKLPSKAPREFKELDEGKSKKGLAEIYEEEYLEKTGAASASLSFSDELKKEANLLFKRLTLKLNALSHFHFAPKPVVEDMTIETNLPALAMEEVAPVAVSDAAMLAPEEVFDGVGKLKEEAELTQDERKRRRAKKKRKFKAEQTKRMAKKPRETPVITQGEGKVAVVKV